MVQIEQADISKTVSFVWSKLFKSKTKLSKIYHGMLSRELGWFNLTANYSDLQV